MKDGEDAKAFLKAITHGFRAALYFLAFVGAEMWLHQQWNERIETHWRAKVFAFLGVLVLAAVVAISDIVTSEES